MDINQDGRIDVADVVARLQQNQAHTRNSRTVTATNTRGFLAWVVEQSGQEHNSYDARGRVDWVVKAILEDSAPLFGLNQTERNRWLRRQAPVLENSRLFQTQQTFDAMDRLTGLTYPDHATVTYTYNCRGLLASIPNVITRYSYNPAGQNARLELTGGMITTYDYDHRLRLSRMRTTRAQDGIQLQNLHYSFDAVSNITRIADGRTAADHTAIAADLHISLAEARQFDNTQDFQYDALYRLTRAANPTAYGTIDYRYDRIGNMILKHAHLLEPDALMDLGSMHSGGALGTSGRNGRAPGEAPGPHAITATEKGPGNAPLTMTYDANGNMTTDRGMTLTWDHKDRLAGLASETDTAVYLYDYTNTRKQKRLQGKPEKTVHYIDQFSEIRNGSLITYVYAGTNRIARATGNANSPRVFQPAVFYLHDHLGSTHFSVGSDGGVGEQMVNYPFGYQRMVHQGASADHLADYRFTGKEKDGESELKYFEARYYNSVVGQFVSSDRLYTDISNLDNQQFHRFVLTPQKLAVYHYGLNNPLKYIDLNGLDEVRASFSVGLEWGYELIHYNMNVDSLLPLPNANVGGSMGFTFFKKETHAESGTTKVTSGFNAKGYLSELEAKYTFKQGRVEYQSGNTNAFKTSHIEITSNQDEKSTKFGFLYKGFGFHVGDSYDAQKSTITTTKSVTIFGVKVESVIEKNVVPPNLL